MKIIDAFFNGSQRLKMAQVKYKRILLKLSGESFCQPGGFGIDGASLESLAMRIAEVGGRDESFKPLYQRKSHNEI